MSKTLRDALNAIHAKTKSITMRLSKQDNGSNRMREGKCPAHSLSCRVHASAHSNERPQKREGTLRSLTQRRTDREWVKSLPVF